MIHAIFKARWEQKEQWLKARWHHLGVPWRWLLFSAWIQSRFLSAFPHHLHPQQSPLPHPRCCRCQCLPPPPLLMSTACKTNKQKQLCNLKALKLCSTATNIKDLWTEQNKLSFSLVSQSSTLPPDTSLFSDERVLLWLVNNWPDTLWIWPQGCSQSPTGPRWSLSSYWTCQICLYTLCKVEDLLNPRMH